MPAITWANPNEALRALEQCLSRPRLSARTRCRLRIQRAKANWRLGHTEQALAEMQHLRQEMSPQKREPLLAVLLIDLAGAQINLAGNFEAALETLAQAQALADLSADAVLKARVLCAMGPLLGRLGQFEEAQRVLRAGLALLPSRRTSSLRWSLELNLGRALIGLERWPEAIGLLEATQSNLSTARATPRGRLSVDQLQGRQRSAQRLLALAYARGGRVAAALALCEQASSSGQASARIDDDLGMSLVHAEALWRAGQRRLAERQFERLQQQARQHGLQAMLDEIQEVLALLHSRPSVAPAPARSIGEGAWPGAADLRLSLLRRDLPVALRGQHLQAWFQPIMNADGHSSHQVELLARWPHRHWGWVPPQEFIALAEQGLCIHDLGRWALTAAAQFLSQQIDAPHLVVGVNLSATQLAHPPLVDEFMGILQSHRIPPQRIVLELTESQPLSADPVVLRRLTALRAAGFGLALDDFGSGFANFDLLDHGLFDQLKIDRSLLAVPQDLGRRRVILETIMGLAAQLDLRVVAEGVESDQQWQLVRHCGVDHFQGYLFAHPMPLPDLQAWLREHASGPQEAR